MAENDEIIPPSDSDDSDNYLTNTNSPLFDTESDEDNSELLEQIASRFGTSSEESENDANSDNELPRRQDEDVDPSNPYGFTESNITNYLNDTEHEDDFVNGWEWSFQPDRGASYGPFLGRNLLLLDPRRREVEDIFDYIFTSDMWTQLTRSTNSYAAKRQEQAREY